MQRLTAFHLDEDVQKVVGVKNNYFDAIDRLFRIALKTRDAEEEQTEREKGETQSEKVFIFEIYLYSTLSSIDEHF